MRGKQCDPYTASQMAVYGMAQAFNISPMQVYEMPMNMVRDFLEIHGEVEFYKNEEMNKKMKNVKR